MAQALVEALVEAQDWDGLIALELSMTGWRNLMKMAEVYLGIVDESASLKILQILYPAIRTFVERIEQEYPDRPYIFTCRLKKLSQRVSFVPSLVDLALQACEDFAWPEMFELVEEIEQTGNLEDLSFLVSMFRLLLDKKTLSVDSPTLKELIPPIWAFTQRMLALSVKKPSNFDASMLGLQLWVEETHWLNFLARFTLSNYPLPKASQAKIYQLYEAGNEGLAPATPREYLYFALWLDRRGEADPLIEEYYLQADGYLGQIYLANYYRRLGQTDRERACYQPFLEGKYGLEALHFLEVRSKVWEPLWSYCLSLSGHPWGHFFGGVHRHISNWFDQAAELGSWEGAVMQEINTPQIQPTYLSPMGEVMALFEYYRLGEMEEFHERFLIHIRSEDPLVLRYLVRMFARLTLPKEFLPWLLQAIARLAEYPEEAEIPLIRSLLEKYARYYCSSSTWSPGLHYLLRIPNPWFPRIDLESKQRQIQLTLPFVASRLVPDLLPLVGQYLLHN